MKNTFAENEDLLFIIRKFLLQFDLSNEEAKILKGSLTENLYNLLYKTFLPSIDPDAPIFQLTDMVMGLNIEMKSKGIDEMIPQIEAKQLEIEYLEQQFDELKTEKRKKNRIDLQLMASIKGKKPEEAYRDITARNYLLSYIDSNIQQIKFLAGKKEETIEETVNRLKKDSSK
jgi:hypothetical protein